MLGLELGLTPLRLPGFSSWILHPGKRGLRPAGDLRPGKGPAPIPEIHKERTRNLLEPWRRKFPAPGSLPAKFQRDPGWTRHSWGAWRVPSCSGGPNSHPGGQAGKIFPIRTLVALGMFGISRRTWRRIGMIRKSGCEPWEGPGGCPGGRTPRDPPPVSPFVTPRRVTAACPSVPVLRAGKSQFSVSF